MRRGELYRVAKPSLRRAKKSRVFVVISREVLIDSKFSAVICAPVYTAYHGLSTQVAVGVAEGLKHESSIYCDELVSLPKSVLTNFISTLSQQKMRQLNEALKVALEVEI